MSSNHASVLSALSSSLLGVHAQVNKLQGGFSRLKLAIGGALSVTAGMALFGVMEKLVDKTKDYNDELIKLQRLGGAMSQAVTSGDISKKAFDIAQRVPMTVTDLAKIPGAGYSILGQDAYDPALWEKLARFQYVMRSQKDYKGDGGEDMAAFLRAGELGGRLTDPNTHKAGVEELGRFLDLSNKVMAATHGMVTPQTMLGMSQQAGFSMRGMTDEGFMNMAIAAQAMGGPRAGTALLSLYNQVGTGKMTAPAAEGMQDLGLLNPDEWYKDHGKVVVSKEAQARLGKILGKNPMDFVDQIYENLEKQGVTDPDEQKRRVAAAMSRQTSERYAIEQMMNHEQIAAERGRMGEAMGSDSSFGLIMNKSVTANMEALQAAWTNLLIAVAGPNSENVIGILKTLTTAINSVTQSVNQMNPETLKNLGIGLGILAGALTGGMVALVAALGPAGWIAVALIGTAAAVTIYWPQIKEFFVNFGNGLKEFGAVLAQGWKEKIDGIKNAIASFIDTIVGLYERVKGFITAKPDKAPNICDQGVMGGLMHLNRFEPGTGQARAQPISLSLNVDGRTLAQAVSDLLDRSTTYPTGAPSPDGGGRHFAGDDNRWQV
jgi:hypothetical protein